jgi:hypothetical protein
VVKRVLKFDPQFIRKGNVPRGRKVGEYLAYLQHLFESQPALGPVQEFAKG